MEILPAQLKDSLRVSLSWNDLDTGRSCRYVGSMKTQTRLARFLPNGIPRYVHCYDNGGPDGKSGSIDRFTVVFTGRYKGRQGCDYLAMSSQPFHPQGFGQHGWNQIPIDANNSGFAPAIGKRNHLGRRIAFQDLPADCQKFVLKDYAEIWGLE